MGVISYIYYKIPYDMIFPDLAPKWVIPVWKQPGTLAINNCGAIYNYCKHVRGTSLVSSPFPIRYRTLLISEKKLIYVKERWQFFVVDKLSAENATKVARRKSAKLKTCHEIFWHLKTLFKFFFCFATSDKSRWERTCKNAHHTRPAS